MGSDKVCMGSDYPFPLGEHHPGKLIEDATLANDIKEKLLWKNGMEWLGR
jgi:aminocarboxymuconate-semialdehyde decarboxylase